MPPSSIAVRCVQEPMPPIWVTSGNPRSWDVPSRRPQPVRHRAARRQRGHPHACARSSSKLPPDNGKDLDAT